MKIENSSVCSLKDYHLIRETKEYRHTPFWFREYLCKDKRLTQTSKVAWMVLSDYSVFSTEYKVQMSLRALGEKIGKDKRTAKRALEELEEYGYIKTNLKNDERGNNKTIIWVRFPQDAASLILGKPDRKMTLKSPNLKVSPIPNIESPLKNENDAVVENGGIFAETGAFMPESGAIVPPINTNNITDLTITKKTNNNVSSNQVGGNTLENRILNQLRDVECLFFEFVERANVLNQQGLNKSEFEKSLWEPYNDWEKQAIERFNTVQCEPLMRNIESIAAAIPVKLKYDQEFANAKIAGMSPLQASRTAQTMLTKEEKSLYDAITWVIPRLTDILEPFSNKVTVQPKEDRSESKNSIIINLNSSNESISVTQSQADKLIMKLKKAAKNGEIVGEASKTDLKILAEQLIFHVEHWSPRLIHYKSSEDRANIAASVALKRMKAGNWSAPYGWIKKEILQRENEVQMLNLMEISALKERVA